MSEYETHQKVTLAEIARDDRLIALSLLRQLVALSMEQLTLALGSGWIDDPPTLREKVEAIVARSTSHSRLLSNGRTNRRGTSPMRSPTTPPPPPRLQAFAHHGAYVGAHRRLGDIAREHLAATRHLDTSIADRVDFDALALDLHLSGLMWTFADQEKVHVFLCPGDSQWPHDKGSKDEAPR